MRFKINLYLIDASLETITSNLGSLGPVDKGLADLTNLEDGGSLDIIPRKI